MRSLTDAKNKDDNLRREPASQRSWR